MSLAEWDLWVALGFLGQIAFGSRFLVQWLWSEKTGKSVIPLYFWYASITGGLILLTYAIHIQDPVFILGQSMGLFVYLRNLYLIFRERKRSPEPSGCSCGCCDH